MIWQYKNKSLTLRSEIKGQSRDRFNHRYIMLTQGTKVRVINKEFADFWKSIKSHKNIWTIDHIKTSVKKQPTLYVCIPEGGKTMYQFQKHEIEEIVE